MPEAPQVERAADGRFPTRRERLRQEVRDDLLRAARELLVPHSTGELSLRAVAREVGIAPSGIYRYFTSRQELVAAVAADAYSSAATALHRSVLEAADLDHAGQALAMAHAYRGWCLSHRAEFSLMFATDAVSEGVGPVFDEAQLHEFFAAPLLHFAAGVRSGVVDTARATLEVGSPLVPALERLRTAHSDALDERQVSILLSGWASFHGFVSLEVHGPLSWFYADLDDAWDRHARGTLRAMGYRDVAAGEPDGPDGPGG